MEEFATPPLERRCPACGATLLAEARFCGACGMETLPAQPAERVERVELAETRAPATEAPSVSATLSPPYTTAAAPVAPTAAAAETTPAPTNSAGRGATIAGIAGGRDCTWCGASNPPEASRCASCGAVFPTPEGDEALERAAQARIQAMESEIKQRRGWWPFRAR